MVDVLKPAIMQLPHEEAVSAHTSTTPPLVTHLSVQRDGAGLALRTDALRPGRVTLTARLDLTADVLQSCKLPSAGD